MKILIVGAGEVGRHMAEHLSGEAHNIVVIEAKSSRAAKLAVSIDGRVLNGNGTSVNVLLEAGVHDCDLFLALTSCNNTNLVSCSLAKQLGAGKTICRVHPEVQREEWLFDFRQQFGVDHLFSTERLAAVELFKFVRNPDALLVEEIARGHIEMQQVSVDAFSEAIGRQLLDLKLPERVRVGAIQRAGEIIIPTAQDTLEKEDLVTVFGEPRKIQDVIAKLGKGIADETLNVVISGGGEYGFALAQMLESWNCRVRILESKAALCADLTDRLTNTTILNVDATNLNELREERVGEVDFFIAATSEDEDNVMTCLQAHNLGAKHCLTLIHRSDYADAIGTFGEHIGVLAAVSPREATRNELMRFVTSDRYHTIKSLDGAQVIECKVTESCAMAGSMVSDVAWPNGSLLVALLHGVHASVPAANDVIKPGDHIYALVQDSARKKFLKLLKKKA